MGHLKVTISSLNSPHNPSFTGDNLGCKTRVLSGGGRMLYCDYFLHAEASERPGTFMDSFNPIRPISFNELKFCYVSIYCCEWVVIPFPIEVHKQDPFLTQNTHSMTLPAKSCFLNFLLPTDLTELPLKIRFRVRMVSLCFITCDNGDRHFQLQTALCVSINNLATHYTSVLECPSS